MLFIFLFFALDALMGDDFIMRVIVDKFLFDNSVVPYCFGLPVLWHPFPVVQAAIADTIRPNSRRDYDPSIARLSV
jgi:hypothetical protein